MLRLRPVGLAPARGSGEGFAPVGGGWARPRAVGAARILNRNGQINLLYKGFGLEKWTNIAKNGRIKVGI